MTCCLSSASTPAAPRASGGCPPLKTLFVSRLRTRNGDRLSSALAREFWSKVLFSGTRSMADMSRRAHRRNVRATTFAPVLAAATALASTANAYASEPCDRPVEPAAINVRVDNDLFGVKEQDQGYTNGMGISLVSPDVTGREDDPCLPAAARWVNRNITWLRPTWGDQRNMVLSISQTIYTPTDNARTDLIEDDRPYVGVLLLAVGYNGRQGDRLEVTRLGVGVAGPAALARQVQNGWHDLIGVDRFEGWDNQIHNEPVIVLAHEKMRRWPASNTPDAGFGADIITHWGGSVGNLTTHANAGVETRIGWTLPDDFGSSTLRPAGENAAPHSSAQRGGGLAGHVFIAADVRLVAHDLTLHGNTFRTSHGVDARPVVGEIGFGAVVTSGRWKFAFGRYFRTKEFEGQRERPVFGSFTVSRAL